MNTTVMNMRVEYLSKSIVNIVNIVLVIVHVVPICSPYLLHGPLNPSDPSDSSNPEKLIPGGAGKAELDGKNFFKLCEASMTAVGVKMEGERRGLGSTGGPKHYSLGCVWASELDIIGCLSS